MANNDFNFRCLAYQDKDGSFTGVCLDLDIVEEEHATLQEAMLSINEAIDSHVEAASCDNFPAGSLYRPAPQRYWNKLRQLMDRGRKLLRKPLQFQFYNYRPSPLSLEEIYADVKVSRRG